MNKTLLISASLLALTASVQAQEQRMRPYIGVDYAYTQLGYSDKKIPTNSASDIFEDSTSGALPYVGVQFNENFSLEVSYLKTEEAEKTNVLGTGVTTTYALEGISADAVLALPVSPKLDLLGITGVGMYQGEIAINGGGLGSVSGNTNDTLGLKIGAGFRYHLTDNFGLRATGQYIKIEDSNSLDHVVIGSAGMYLIF